MSHRVDRFIDPGSEGWEKRFFDTKGDRLTEYGSPGRFLFSNRYALQFNYVSLFLGILDSFLGSIIFIGFLLV